MSEKAKAVLIAEDGKAMASVLVHKFTAAGIQALHVTSGDQVLPNLQKSRFDLLLLDLMMPEMDGFEVLKKMQELGLTTPVIVLSNLAQTEDILKVKYYGARDYIVKSAVTPAEILGRVEEFLRGDLGTDALTSVKSQ